MVGTRHPEQGYLHRARAFAAAVAGAGAGVVSGAAAGVDRSCHLGALDVGGETWAFLGSALDEVDPAQARLVPLILDGGGAVYSELPPGIRASTHTFPRRNRLISGASDAVLVLRAGRHSGAMHTVAAARAQGRPILACPGRDLGGGGAGLQPAGGARARAALHRAARRAARRGTRRDAATARDAGAGADAGPVRPRRRSCTRWSTGSRGTSRSWRTARGWSRAEW